VKQEKGYLIKSDKEAKKSLVVITEPKRCKECEGGCEACTFAKRYWRVAENKIDAEVGDYVLVNTQSWTWVRLMLWGIPVVFAALVFALMLSYGVTTAIVMFCASLPAAYLAIYLSVGSKTFFHKKIVITDIDE
jgi:hypothetical protein